MFLFDNLKKYCTEPPIPWILGAILGLAMGPTLAQESLGSFWGPSIAARSAVLMNATTGEILFAKDPHLQLPPASTTKVLTALLALERLDLNARLQASSQAASAVPSRIGLHAGEAASTQDLLYGLMLKSGNDAAETLAEAAGGSIYGFADMMNAKAWQIGARNSHFMNPHGLPNEQHYSTAYDLALIFRHAMNYPMFSDIVRTRSAMLRIESNQNPYNSRLVQVLNHNRLLVSYEGTRGGKTGFTIKARRCFVGEVDRGGNRLIVSILNSPSSKTLWEDARILLDYGFARYGLAPAPTQSFQPQPILVQRTPATWRTAMARPADEDDAFEPVGALLTPAPSETPSRIATLQREQRTQRTPQVDFDHPANAQPAITIEEEKEPPRVAQAQQAPVSNPLPLIRRTVDVTPASTSSTAINAEQQDRSLEPARSRLTAAAPVTPILDRPAVRVLSDSDQPSATRQSRPAPRVKIKPLETAKIAVPNKPAKPVATRWMATPKAATLNKPVISVKSTTVATSAKPASSNSSAKGKKAALQPAKVANAANNSKIVRMDRAASTAAGKAERSSAANRVIARIESPAAKSPPQKGTKPRI